MMPTRRTDTLCLALCAALLLALCVAATAADGPVEPKDDDWRANLSLVAGGFLSNSITAVSVTGESVWVGTDRGLAVTDSNGRLWENINLAAARTVWSKRTGSPSPAELRRRGYVTRIVAMPKITWVGTLDGLFTSSGGDWFLVGLGKGLEEGAVWDIAVSDRHMWLVGREGVFHSINNGAEWSKEKNIIPEGEETMAMHSVFARVAASGNTVWLAPRSVRQEPGRGFSIVRGDLAGARWQRVFFGASVDENKPTININAVRADGPEVWLATSVGLFISSDDGRHWRHIASGGLPSINVLDALKVGDRLWLGTADGVAHSDDDGQTWTPDAYPRGRMTCIGADAQALWIGTDGGLLRRLSGGRFWQCFTDRSEVRAVAVQQEQEHSIWWVGTRGGLARSTDAGRSWELFTVADRLPSNVINGISVDGGRVWVATEGGIAMRRHEGAVWSRYGFDEGLISTRVFDIAAKNGIVWAATEHGLSKLDAKAAKFRNYKQTRAWQRLAFDGTTLLAASSKWSREDMAAYVNDAMQPAELPIYRVVRTIEDGIGWEDIAVDGYRGGEVYGLALSDGNYWMLSEHGLFRSRDEGRSWARYGSESLWGHAATCFGPFPDGGVMVQSVLQQPASPFGMWSVTRGYGQDWQMLTPRLPAMVTSMAIDGSTVICGGRTGLYVLKRAASDRVVDGRPGWLVSHQMAQLAASYAGGRFNAVGRIDPYGLHGPGVWTAVRGRGVIHRTFPLTDELHRMERQPQGELSGPVGSEVFAICPTPDAVWFGSDAGATCRRRDGAWIFLAPSNDGLRGSIVHAIALGRGGLWFGTDRGLSILDEEKGTWTHMDKSNSPLPDRGVTALQFLAGSMWVGTGSGLFRNDPSGAWQLIEKSKGAHVFDMAPGEDALAVATDRGLLVSDAHARRVMALDPSMSDLPTSRVDRVIVDGPDVWAGAGGAFVRVDVTLDFGARRTHMPTVQLSPESVLVVVNGQSTGGRRVGEHYMAARGIPEKNLVVIDAPLRETITRDVYNDTIRRPVLEHIVRNGLAQKIACIVTTYGVPLRIAPLRGKLGPHDEDRLSTRASVDSELTLLGRPHPLAGPLANRYLHRDEPFDACRFAMYLVSRLDGPDAQAAIALVDHAISAEKNRSFTKAGWGYVDTGGGLATHPELASPLKENFHDLDRQVTVEDRAKIVDNLTTVRGQVLDAYFYMAWRDERIKPPTLGWPEGGVAMLLGPVSAQSVRDVRETWAAQIIKNGATGLFGNAYNPSPQSMSELGNVIENLQRGYTWAEAVTMGLPYISWQHVIIGDPLYRPVAFQE